MKRLIPMNLIDSIRKYRSYRNTVSELSRLSTRELADLGIQRGDIRQLARQAA